MASEKSQIEDLQGWCLMRTLFLSYTHKQLCPYMAFLVCVPMELSLPLLGKKTTSLLGLGSTLMTPLHLA